MDEFINKKTLLSSMHKLQESVNIQTDPMYKTLVARLCEAHRNLVADTPGISLSEAQKKGTDERPHSHAQKTISYKCPYSSPDVIDCKPDGENCDRCGWNPAVANARLNALTVPKKG